jgi:hypothetical protein
LSWAACFLSRKELEMDLNEFYTKLLSVYINTKPNLFIDWLEDFALIEAQHNYIGKESNWRFSELQKLGELSSSKIPSLQISLDYFLKKERHIVIPAIWISPLLLRDEPDYCLEIKFFAWYKLWTVENYLDNLLGELACAWPESRKMVMYFFGDKYNSGSSEKNGDNPISEDSIIGFNPKPNKPPQIDPTDERILLEIAKDPSISDQQLARRLGRSRPTTNFRRKALEKMGFSVRG